MASTGASVDDHELLAAIAGGDSFALAEAFDRHGAAVYSWLRRSVNRPAAEDLTVAVFVSLWRAPARFADSFSSLHVLLLSAAYRHAAALYREPA